MLFFAKYSPILLNLGWFFARTAIGLIFIVHGAFKFMQGREELIWTGSQMQNFGITFWFLFWGICAASAELLGGISLTLGLFTRVAAFFMAFAMLVAIVHHIKRGDPWGYISFPLSYLVFFIGVIIAGSGKYSLDYYFFGS